MNFSITKFGKKLKKSLYTWDKNTKTLKTEESRLVLDFSNISDVTFETGSMCVFYTEHRCTFNTGSNCLFKTGYDCSFRTNSDCVFSTSFGCVFTTGHRCTFNVGQSASFDTGSNCVFKVAGINCTFNTREKCIIIRRDIHEVIEIPEDAIIKLNKNRGYKMSHKNEIVTINDKRYYKDEVDGALKKLQSIE